MKNKPGKAAQRERRPFPLQPEPTIALDIELAAAFAAEADFTDFMMLSQH